MTRLDIALRVLADGAWMARRELMARAQCPPGAMDAVLGRAVLDGVVERRSTGRRGEIEYRIASHSHEPLAAVVYGWSRSQEVVS